MSITTTGNLGPMILQSLAPAMLYVPTSAMNYITICDKVSMPVNGGTTCRFMRPRALTPPTIQLGNSGIDKPRRVDVKPSLIDLDILAAQTEDNKAEPERDRERLSERDAKAYAIVCSATIYEIAEGDPKRFPRLAAARGQKSNSQPPAQVPQRDIIDGANGFFWNWVYHQQQVILQDQEGFRLAA